MDFALGSPAIDVYWHHMLRHGMITGMGWFWSNSPFRPFVLATTSIGQEGLDFHTILK